PVRQRPAGVIPLAAAVADPAGLGRRAHLLARRPDVAGRVVQPTNPRRPHWPEPGAPPPPGAPPRVSVTGAGRRTTPRRRERRAATRGAGRLSTKAGPHSRPARSTP